MVSDDGQPKPPFLPGVLRSCTKKPGVPQPVKTIPLGDLHMSIATSLYRPLIQKDVSIQTWLLALFNLWKNRQRLVGDLTLPNYLAYERDEQDVPETLQFGGYRLQWFLGNQQVAQISLCDCLEWPRQAVRQDTRIASVQTSIEFRSSS